MISVIVVSYEASRVLPRCLESVADLASEGHEVWVVDNASSDGSVDVVRRDFPFCRVVELDHNVGFGAANNRAAAAASGDLLLLLNPDAWLLPGCAEGLSAAMDADGTLALAAPTIRYPDGRPQFNWSPSSGLLGEALQTGRNALAGWRLAHRPCARLLRALGNRGWYTASCCLLRRSAFEQVGGFDERFFLYFEDVDLCERLLDAGWRMTDVPSAEAFHEKGAITAADADKVEYRRSQFLYYEKSRGPVEARALLRRQRRRFERESDPEYRGRLLAVWREADERLASARDAQDR